MVCRLRRACDSRSLSGSSPHWAAPASTRAADFGIDNARNIIAVPQLFGTTVIFIDLDNLQ